MLKGTCPKCGQTVYGWALKNPKHQTCQKCGEKLEVTEALDKVAIEMGTHFQY